MITRFAVLPDNRRLMLGIDRAELFEAGMVYEASEMLDEIIIRKIGPYALQEKGPGYPSELSDANSQIQAGLHLITKEEAKSL